MPNYRRYYAAGREVFITIVTRGRRPWLADATRITGLLYAMERVKQLYRFKHVAHVVLPDHLHWMLVPDGDGNFSQIVGAVKRETTWRAKQMGLEIGTGLWQARFYDHVIRNESDFARHLDYIHYNPVKHRLAANAGAYAHSSFAVWVERGIYPSDWGNEESEPQALAGMNLE